MEVEIKLYHYLILKFLYDKKNEEGFHRIPFIRLKDLKPKERYVELNYLKDNDLAEFEKPPIYKNSVMGVLDSNDDSVTPTFENEENDSPIYSKITDSGIKAVEDWIKKEESNLPTS